MEITLNISRDLAKSLGYIPFGAKHRMEVPDTEMTQEFKKLGIVLGTYKPGRYAPQGINDKLDDGYMYRGDFIGNGTKQIDNDYHIYLVASTDGSRKYQETIYRVVLLKNGKFVRTDICTSSKSNGWALRLKKAIKQLLQEATHDAPTETE